MGSARDHPTVPSHGLSFLTKKKNPDVKGRQPLLVQPLLHIHTTWASPFWRDDHHTLRPPLPPHTATVNESVLSRERERLREYGIRRIGNRDLENITDDWDDSTSNKKKFLGRCHAYAMCRDLYTSCGAMSDTPKLQAPNPILVGYVGCVSAVSAAALRVYTEHCILSYSAFCVITVGTVKNIYMTK